MTRRPQPSRAVLIGAVICLAMLLGGWPALAGGQTPDISVIVHPGVTEENLSTAELRQILTGDREFWKGGTRVTIFVRAPPARERDLVLRDLCQMTEAQFRSHWIGKVFRAETPSTPKIVYSNDAALEQVGRTPGAIAFIQGTVTAKNVKVLKIDGRAPGQTGYRLK
jgi:ABC-type phosphate transport system substrate-binding protein